jgi:hypothetical protein
MTKLNRRKFFGIAAATSAAAVVPMRGFARSLDDRPGPKQPTAIDTTDIIFRFYHAGEEFFSYPVTVSSYTHDGVIHIGANESVRIEPGFVGKADDLGVSLAAFPDQVTRIGFGVGHPSGVNIHDGDTLTLEGSPKGFLTLS